MNYIGLGIEPTGQFLQISHPPRSLIETDFFKLCEEYWLHDCLMPLEPFALDLKETDVMAGEHL